MARPVNVCVELGGRIKSTEQLIRKFVRCCKQEGFLRELKIKSRYVSKGEKRRRKRHAAKRRGLKDIQND